MSKFSTLSSRLMLWYGTAFAASFAMIFAIFFYTIKTTLLMRMDEDLKEDIIEYQRILKKDGLDGIKNEIDRERMMYRESEKSFIEILSPEGDILFTTDLNPWQGLEINASALNLIQNSTTPFLYNLELKSRDDTARAMYAKISSDYILHEGESMDEKQQLLNMMYVTFWGLLIVVLPFAIYVGSMISKKAVKGIKSVSKTAKAIEKGHLNKRVAGDMWGDEVSQLADTFNAMLDRINDLITEMSELSDNVAHDLRTPLTRIRIIAESEISQTKNSSEIQADFANIIEECDRMIDFINTSLDLTELEAGAVKLVKEPVNVSVLLEEAIELFQPLSEEKNIIVQKNIKPDLILTGHIQSLQRMLANLLDNAIKYSHQNGLINVSMEGDDNFLRVIIEDHGTGIKDIEQEKVFDRFYRCDQSRDQNGCGLGLSYARSVARAHGGDIQLQSSLDQGSIFTVILEK